MKDKIILLFGSESSLGKELKKMLSNKGYILVCCDKSLLKSKHLIKKY